MSQGVEELIEKVNMEGMTPIDFCNELAKLGVQPGFFSVYLENVFGLRLDTAKCISLKVQFGSTKAWRNYKDEITDDKIAIGYVSLKGRNLSFR